MTSDWLTLQEYSNRYKVSISTLRRKIKAKDVEHTFKNGRYLLRASDRHLNPETSSMSELKSLYQNLLKEKDQQIQFLKTELEDLNQLVLVLEKENQQLKSICETHSLVQAKQRETLI